MMTTPHSTVQVPGTLHLVSPPGAVPRLLFIDSLRGLAALYVIAFHLVLIPHPNLVIPAWIAPLVLNGWTGVTLFFVISAFTLCLTLDGRQDRPHSTYNFYVRRFFRIAPLYYVWLAIMVVWWWGISFASFWAYKLAFLKYALFIFNFFPGNQVGLVQASWTLGVEVLFYAAFPFIFRRVYTLKRSFFFLGFTLVLAVIHSLVLGDGGLLHIKDYNLTVGFLSQLPIFAIGMTMYFLHKEYKDHAFPKAWVRGLAIVSIGAFFVVPYLWKVLEASYKMPPLSIYYLMAVVFALIILSLSRLPTAFLTNRTAVFFGLISYSLYLNHPVLLERAAPLYARVYAGAGGTLQHYLTCLLLTLIVVTAISYVTYRLIEEPFISLAKRFLKS